MKYGQSKDVKLYFTISEVVDQTGVPAHILRYWEQEFTMLRPRKNRAGNRVYKDRDIDLVKKIKHLLQVERFTIEGASKRLRESGIQDVVESPEVDSPETEIPAGEILPLKPLVQEGSPQTEILEEPVAQPVQRPTASNPDLIRELREIRNMLR
jgi:DNA-binding transcriptional MerR regulator